MKTIAIVQLLVVGLMAISLPSCNRISSIRAKAQKARIQATRAQLQNVRTAVDLYIMDCGVPPTTAQGLDALLKNPGLKDWDGPYIAGKTRLTDAWRTPFRYERTGTIVRIESAGPDRAFGTTDDIFTEFIIQKTKTITEPKPEGDGLKPPP